MASQVGKVHIALNCEGKSMCIEMLTAESSTRYKFITATSQPVSTGCITSPQLKSAPIRFCLCSASLLPSKRVMMDELMIAVSAIQQPWSLQGLLS